MKKKSDKERDYSNLVQVIKWDKRGTGFSEICDVREVNLSDIIGYTVEKVSDNKFPKEIFEKMRNKYKFRTFVEVKK